MYQNVFVKSYNEILMYGISIFKCVPEFFLFQKSSECWMCVSLQECNKLIKTPAKSILLTEKKKLEFLFLDICFAAFYVLRQRIASLRCQPKG